MTSARVVIRLGPGKKIENDVLMEILSRRGKKNPFKPQLESVEKALQTFFGKRPEVILAYLFGSYTSRSAAIFHDIDVAALLSPDRLRALDRTLPYGYGADLSSKLARIIRYDPVDVVLLNHAPPLLILQVIGTGRSPLH